MVRNKASTSAASGDWFKGIGEMETYDISQYSSFGV